jgi:hypothetical protein
VKTYPKIDHGRGPVKRRFAKRAAVRIERKVRQWHRRSADCSYCRMWMIGAGDGTEWIRGERFVADPEGLPF